MNKYITSLLNQGEHQLLDFKHSISDSKKIARSLVAFANTDGGKLLIGVRDNGSIAGIKSDEEYYMIDAAANMYCKPTINFQTKVWELNGKTILEITVPKLTNDVLYAAPDKNGFFKVYIRVNDENIIVNDIYIKVWNKRKYGKGVLLRYNEPEKKLFDYLQKNQSITLSMFRKITNLTYYKAKNILINLIVLNILKIDFSENQTVYKLVK